VKLDDTFSIKLLLSFSLLASVSISGCAEMKPAATASANLPAREILIRGREAPPGFGAYGYLLFTARPSPITLPRYLAVCEAYERTLEPIEEFSGIEPAQLMVTFWPLRSEPEPLNCPVLVDDYDFARSTMMARAVGKLGVPGPVLVAWQYPFSDPTNNPEREALVFDMSDFRDEEEITRAFLIWQAQISREPLAWKDGFNMALIREKLRMFLNTYGEQIVAIVHGN